MDMPVAAEVRELAIRASGDDVRPASAWVDEVCRAQDVPAEQIFRLDLCLNEVLANIIAHGGPSAEAAPVLLALSVRVKAGEAELSVSDSGKAFNPLAVAPKTQAHSLDEAMPGGLGLGMIHSYSDRLDYEFRSGRNHLKILVRWEVA